MKPESGWQRRLRDFVLDEKNRGRKEYSLNRLAEIANAPSVEQLSYELSTLVINGLIVPVYRIRSRSTGVGIAEYPSITQIPLEIFDDTVGRSQKIDLVSDIELLYRMKQ